MPAIYGSLREGNTKIKDETGNIFRSIVTDEDMNASLKETLGLEQTSANELTATDSNGAELYSIRSLHVDAGESDSGQLKFSIEFDLEIYIAGYRNVGSIVVPMKVVSSYWFKS